MLNLNKELSNRLLNLGLRSISMLSRFLLILSIAKLLSPSDLGIFGLLVTGVGFFVLIFGMDFYGYANRELVSVKDNDYSKVILNQIYAYIPIYLLLMPLIVFLFYQEILPWEYFFWFLSLAFVEHISIEQNRLLNIIQRQLSATIVLFLRSASWAIVIIPTMLMYETFKNLETLLMGWLIGGLSSIIFGSFIIQKMTQKWKFVKPDYQWIIKGYKTALLFFIGTLSFKVIAIFDKFWLEWISNSEIVGVYIFYSSLVMGATAFIHAGLIVFSGPKIVKSFQEGELEEFTSLLNKFFKELLIAVGLMVTLLYIFMPLVIEWIDKPIYIEHYNIFHTLVFIGVFMVLSNHPHTFLYASRRDRYMLFSNISALVIFVISSTWLQFTLDNSIALYKVATSVAITFLWLLFIKYVGYFYYTNKRL